MTGRRLSFARRDWLRTYSSAAALMPESPVLEFYA